MIWYQLSIQISMTISFSDVYQGSRILIPSILIPSLWLCKPRLQSLTRTVRESNLYAGMRNSSRVARLTIATTGKSPTGRSQLEKSTSGSLKWSRMSIAGSAANKDCVCVWFFAVTCLVGYRSSINTESRQSVPLSCHSQTKIGKLLRRRGGTGIFRQNPNLFRGKCVGQNCFVAPLRAWS